MAEGTELAKAYVQIIPSAQGIKGKITEACSWWACTPSSWRSPKKWNVELFFFHSATRFCHLGLLNSSPEERPSSMRLSSCTTMRPAPMLRWPTSELP